MIDVSPTVTVTPSFSSTSTILARCCCSVSSFMSNSPSVASLLPPDIIYIIACLVHPDPKIKLYPIHSNDFADLTRVCRHWRYALLSYPAFWTNIEVPLKSMWFLEEVLRRSADYPLDVSISLDQKQARSLEVAFSHLHRIRVLTLQDSYPPTPDWDYIFRFFDNKPAPALQVVTFKPLSERPWEKNRGSVPENFLVNMAPNLEELSIASMTISHQMPILKTITRLHLEFVWGITSVHQLFDMLENTSHLQVLKLHSLNELSPVFNVQDLNNRSIQFPALKALSLNLGPEILMAVLSHTTLPSGIDWRIYSQDALTKSAVDIAPLLSFVSKTRNGTCLTLRMITETELQMDFAQKPSGPYNISARMRLSGEEHCIRRLNSMFVNFGLSKVHFCDIIYPMSTSGTPYWLVKYQTTFNSLFYHFDHLEKLIVACERTKALWQFMENLLPEEESTTLPCPLLTDLKVGVVSTLGKTLAIILTRRKEAGSVLTNLCVEYDYYDRSIRKFKPVLEELAENVEVASLTLKIQDEVYFLERIPFRDNAYYETRANSYTRIPYTGRYDTTVI